MIKLLLTLLLLAGAAFGQDECTFTITPSGNPDVPRTGGRFTNVQVKPSSPDCTWTVRAPDWITVEYGFSGMGDGVFAYRVLPNTSFLPRIGHLLIGNRGFPVTQRGCTYQVAPGEVYFFNPAGTGEFRVASDCEWEALSNAQWLRITSIQSGVVSYTVDENQGGAGRTGTIHVGPPGSTDILSAVHAVNQGGDTLIPRAVTLSASGGSAAFSVIVRPDLAWTAMSASPWVRVVSGNSGVGQGSVTYTVDPNPSPEPRSATIFAGGMTFSITQAGNACRYELTPSFSTIGGNGGLGTFELAANCPWSASTSVSWLSVVPTSGQGSSAVTFTAAPNNQDSERTGVLNVGGQPFTVTQSGRGCEFKLTPAGAAIGISGGSGTFQVAAPSGCSWTAIRNADWIDLVGSSPSEAGYIVYPNPSAQPRTATISVGGSAFTLTQAGRGPQVSTGGIVNAASYGGGAIAPGEIVTIFGDGIGPPELVRLQLSVEGLVSKDLAGTRVFFDDAAAPLVYVHEKQVSAIVPYSVAGKPSVEVRVEYLDSVTSRVRMAVAPASPALFTLDASGSGPGAILNEDYSLNDAAHPAARGSVVMLYATGEGETDPAGADGRITTSELSRPRLPVTALIGGLEADVIYAGTAPGLVAGVLQLNVRIPAGVVPGSAVPVQIRVGDFSSPPGVTLAVRE